MTAYPGSRRAALMAICGAVIQAGCRKQSGAAVQPPVNAPPLPSAQPPAQQPAAPPRRPTQRAAPPAGTPPEPAGGPKPDSPPAPAPSLGEMLSSDDQRRYNLSIDEDLGRARASLAAITDRRLSRQQLATVQQVRNFIQQAEQMRKTDVVSAKGLSRKADVLARDLARAVQ